jgi:hypothetical protein
MKAAIYCENIAFTVPPTKKCEYLKIGSSKVYKCRMVRKPSEWTSLSYEIIPHVQQVMKAAIDCENIAYT